MSHCKVPSLFCLAMGIGRSLMPGTLKVQMRPEGKSVLYQSAPAMYNVAFFDPT